jgi:cold shock CspA family protein
MGKSQETFSKKEKEKKRLQKRKEKQEKREMRKADSDKGKSLEDMMAYVDENGNITDTPPDPKKKKEIRSEDISLTNTGRDTIEEVDEVRTGTVTFFITDKGYGFIKDNRTGESIFVHANNLTHPVKDNDKVTFKVEKGEKGLVAVEVNLLR